MRDNLQEHEHRLINAYNIWYRIWSRHEILHKKESFKCCQEHFLGPFLHELAAFARTFMTSRSNQHRSIFLRAVPRQKRVADWIIKVCTHLLVYPREGLYAKDEETIKETQAENPEDQRRNLFQGPLIDIVSKRLNFNRTYCCIKYSEENDAKFSRVPRHCGVEMKKTQLRWYGQACGESHCQVRT